MRLGGVSLALTLALPAAAGVFDSPGERAAFQAELRAAILANGDVIAEALAGPQPARSEMQQYIEDDLDLLTRLAPQLLQGRDLALFTARDCETCAAARTELQALSERHGACFILHDLEDPQAAAWARQLGLTEAPFYVLPDMVLRGHMPPIVLRKYLDR